MNIYVGKYVEYSDLITEMFSIIIINTDDYFRHNYFYFNKIIRIKQIIYNYNIQIVYLFIILIIWISNTYQ